MRRTRLTTALVALPLAAVACGTATSTAPGVDPGGSITSTPGGSTVTAQDYAATLLRALNVPSGATPAAQSPSKALDHLPETPSLSKTPTVVKRFWTVDKSAAAVLAWLGQHGTDTSLEGNGSGDAPSTAPSQTATHYLTFKAASLPAGMAFGNVYVAVVSTGSGSAAIAAYAVTLAQPPRPAAENVPLDLSKATIGWSLAPGGTPVLKPLTGKAAVDLARDFNALTVDTAGNLMCPLMQAGSEITVTFTGDGHTWKVVVPACPDIGVTRDGQKLPGLTFGKAFMDDLKSYVGRLPQSGPISADGGAIPLVQTPSGH